MAEKTVNNVDKALNFPKGEAFEKHLAELIDNPNGDSNLPIVIAVFDIDNFMRVNDKFGIEIGDKALITVANHVKDNLPKGVEIYRIGGDEFGVIFAGKYEREDVFLLMDSIRKSLECKLPDGDIITISVGIAEAFEDASRVQELMRKAESALFRAKVNGRDKVALAKEEKMVPKTSHYTQDQLKALTKLSKKEGIGEAILLREALDILLKKYDI